MIKTGQAKKKTSYKFTRPADRDIYSVHSHSGGIFVQSEKQGRIEKRKGKGGKRRKKEKSNKTQV